MMIRLPPVEAYHREAMYSCTSCLSSWVQVSAMTECKMCGSIYVIWINHPLRKSE